MRLVKERTAAVPQRVAQAHAAALSQLRASFISLRHRELAVGFVPMNAILLQAMHLATYKETNLSIQRCAIARYTVNKIYAPE